MPVWGFHWFPWGQHIQGKKANFGCMLPKKNIILPWHSIYRTKHNPLSSAIKNRENMKHDVAVCPDALLVTGYWELFQWMPQTPSSDLSLIVVTDLELQAVCRGNNNWHGQNRFLGQFAGPSLLHSIAHSRIGVSFVLKFLYAMLATEKACGMCSHCLLSFWGWLTFPVWSKWVSGHMRMRPKTFLICTEESWKTRQYSQN